MQPDPASPSRTALRVALRRAAHQVVDRPVVFEDPIAVPILGKRYAEELRRTPVRADRPFSVALRAFLVARSCYAEEMLRRAVENGVEQYVLLGAGLDTFAYRNPFPRLRVFEVDHPATQLWKRELLAESGIAIPASLRYAPVDFEHQALPEQLVAAGFDTNAPAFFAWLGVTMYLTLPAFRSTLQFVRSQNRKTGLVFDYSQPREALPFLERLGHDSLAERVKLAGEPFQLFFTPAQAAGELDGFRDVEDLGADQVNARYFHGRNDDLRMRGSAARLVSAWI